MKNLYLFALLSLCLFTAPVAAQDEVGPDGQGRRPDVNSASELQLEFVQVDRADEMIATLEQIYGRQIQIVEDGVARRISNLMLLGNTIVIHELPAKIKEISVGIARLQAATEAGKPQSILVHGQIKPRHISLDDTITALGSLARVKPMDNASAPRVATKGTERRVYQNLTVLESRGIILVHDTAENLAEMERIFVLVDTPQTQVMIRCRIIQGDPDLEVGDAQLDALLPQEMKDLTRMKHFKTLAAGAIRTAAGDNMPIEMNMSGANGIDAMIEIRSGGYSVESKTLRIDRLGLRFIGEASQSLQTSTTLPAGEVVVVGALGDNPIFVVLEMTVLAR